MDTAIGMIEVEGVGGCIAAADAACKAAAVTLLGWTSTGGYTTVFFSGSVSAVAAGLSSGEQAARAVIDHVVAVPLTQPESVCRHYISFAPQDQPAPPGALGWIETRGYGVHVHTNDLMVKAADVDVYSVLTVHNRVVCSLILGPVGAVREALAVGRKQVAEAEHFLSSALIPQPVPEVLQAFGQQN